MENGNENCCRCSPPTNTRSKRCNPEQPYFSIRKLVSLMESPLSTDLYERQIMVLNDFIDATPDAFFIRDLPYVMRLIEILIERANEVCLFRKPLETILLLCATPPLLIKSSDIIEYERDLKEYFSFLGYLLVRIQEIALQDYVIHALKKLLTRKTPANISYITLETTSKAIEGSRLPNVITKFLEVAEEDLYVKLLEVAVILASMSDIVCQKMIKEKAINHLLIRLNPYWKNPYQFESETDTKLENFESASKILWALLKALRNSNSEFLKSVAEPNWQVFCGLRYALRTLTNQKRSEINRNHIMGILLQLLDLLPIYPLIKSGLAVDISILAVATEIGTGGTWASAVRFNTKETDYEFKKMLLLALWYCCKDVEVLKIMHPKRIMPALLKLITPELSPAWHPQQLCKLTSLTLHVLQVLVPCIPHDFLYYNGNLRLLMMVDYYNLQPYEVTMLEDCLKALNHITATKNMDILDDLVKNVADNILITLCDNLLSREILPLPHQRCLAYAFSTLEYLYQLYIPSETTAVHLSMKFLKRAVNPHKEDSIYDPNFLICSLSFLWDGIVPYEENIKLFVSLGGVYILLDLIQRSIFPIKMVALAALVDMCEEGSCIPHLVTWRSKGQKLLPLLLEIFRTENSKLEVKSTPHGTIADIEIPIMGQQQWFETFFENKNPNSSPAIVDLLASCRPKVYAIIQLLNHRHDKRVDLANEHYKLFNPEDISIEDQLTLLLAENFLGLKLGEAWVEVNKDLENMGIRPLTIDGEMVGLLKHRVHKWGLHIKTIQEEILHKEHELDSIDERILYNTLRDSKLIESLQALHELDYIARTTEKMFRLVSKMKQTTQIERALEFTEGAVHHRTCMHGVLVNPIFGQQISIQSNIIVDPKDRQIEVDPVSSESETDNDFLKEEEVHPVFSSHISTFD